MENNKNIFDKLAEKYPFLTVCRYDDEEFVGIIQNRDATITSLYSFGELPTTEAKELFLSLGEQWWWESNRSIPINIFLRTEWAVFKPYSKTFANKSLEILAGPTTSLNEIVHKKKKRKSITLVRRMDD
jgi:hypothetical protein